MMRNRNTNIAEATDELLVTIGAGRRETEAAYDVLEARVLELRRRVSEIRQHAKAADRYERPAA